MEQRAERVIEMLDDLGSSLGTPSLAEVLNAHPDRIEDFDSVLGALGALAGGADGLARLARDATVPRRDQVSERWMAELTAAGRLAAAITIGAEAIASIDPSPPGRPSPISTASISVRPATRVERSAQTWSGSVTTHRSEGFARYSMTPMRPGKRHPSRR